MNYKHIVTDNIISEAEYQQLSPSEQAYYLPCRKRPDDDDDLIAGAGLLIAGMALLDTDTSSSVDTPDSSPDVDFGGGESGGGGAGSDS